MPLPITASHTLCEPARSKCTSTCHKGHFIRKFTGKMPFPRTAAQTSREPAHQHVTGGTSYGNLRKNAIPQNRDPHFVRACAVEMHTNKSLEPLYTEIYRKNAGTGLYSYRKNPLVWTQCYCLENCEAKKYIS
jgi:hypothetical protein